jgi:2-methylcitrate dehydratase PrpD
MSQVWSTDALAEWCVALDARQLPDAVIAKAEDCILDAIACAMVGRTSPSVGAVETVAHGKYKAGPAAVWFTDQTLHPIGAAFINATAASILDIDDGQRAALGHPGAAVVPAALAASSAHDCSGLDLLAAIVAGYETAVRIGSGEQRKAYHTGNWSSFGAATAAACLAGLDAEGHAQALAVAAYHGPRVSDLTLSQDMGRSVKESIPWSVVAGMSAADLAAAGFTGCRDALDIEERFIPGKMVDGLGDELMIMGTYFKRYSACRWGHSAVEVLLDLMASNALDAGQITSIHVETFDQAAGLDNLADPPTLESAQYSVPYCLGLAATMGEHALMPINEECLHYQPAVAFAGRVRVEATPEMNAKFPERAAARVNLETAKGNFSAELVCPWGDAGTGISRADLVEKFHVLAEGVMPAARVDAIAAAVDRLKYGAIQSLTDLLNAPLEPAIEARRVAAND